MLVVTEAQSWPRALPLCGMRTDCSRPQLHPTTLTTLFTAILNVAEIKCEGGDRPGQVERTRRTWSSVDHRMGSLGCIVCEKAAGKILRLQVVAGGEVHLLSERCKSASIAGVGVLTGLWSKIEPLIHETEQLLPTAEVEIAG